MNLWKCGTKLNTKQTFATHFTLPIKVHGYWLHTSGMNRATMSTYFLLRPVSLVEPRADVHGVTSAPGSDTDTGDRVAVLM